MLNMGRDFWASLASREPFARRQKRLFERGVISEITEDVVAVCVGCREDGSEILLEEVPVVAGYNPQVGDWVVIRYDAGHGGAPMVFGPSVADGSEEEPSTSSGEVVAARSSARYGAHASLDARLEEHEQDGTDPHGAALTQTSKVRTPLVEAAENLNLAPGAGGQVTVGDTGSGGTFRPVVVADEAYQTLTNSEAFKVAAARATSVGGYLESHELYPTGTDNTKSIDLANLSMIYTGNNLSNVNSRVLRLALDFRTTGSFPAVGSSHPLCVVDCNVSAGNDFTGTVADAVGIFLHPYFQSDGVTGKYTTLSMIRGGNAIAANGQVTTLNWIELPSSTYNEVNNFLKLGNGNFLTGNIVWKADAAATVPLAIQGYAGQSGDLQRWQNSTPTVLAKITAAGILGIDHIAENTGSHGVLFDNKIGILEGGATPTKYTYLQGGDQNADLTYTLPVNASTGYLLNTAGVLSWVAAPSAAAHNLLSATHGDTQADTVAQGDILIGSGATWARLAGNSTTTRQFLMSKKIGPNVQPPSWEALLAADIPALAYGPDNAPYLTNGAVAGLSAEVDITGATVLTFGGRNQMAAIGLGAAAHATVPLYSYAASGLGYYHVSTGASGSSGGASIQLHNDDGAALASGDRMGFLLWGGAKDNAHTLALPCLIGAYTTEAWGTSALGCQIVLQVTPNGSTTRATKFTVDQDGSIIAPQVYATTVTASRDVEVDSTGKLGYVSSSIVDKENVRELADVSWLHALQPVIYDRKDGSVRNEIGLIAEEVLKVYPEIVSYKREVLETMCDEEGHIVREIYGLTDQPETVNYKRLIVPLLLEVQQLRKELDAAKEALKVA